jgi:hypothetical protein
LVLECFADSQGLVQSFSRPTTALVWRTTRGFIVSNCVCVLGARDEFVCEFKAKRLGSVRAASTRYFQ